MNKLVIALLLFAFFSEYLVKQTTLLPGVLVFGPELLSLVAGLIVAIKAAVDQDLVLGRRYLVVLGFLLLSIAISAVVNDMKPGVIFAGARTFLKFTPFFLLAAVYVYRPAAISKQLWLLLAIALVQIPLVLYQRFVQFAGAGSGDNITGTLAISSVLSIFLVSCIAMVVAFYLRRRIRLGPAIALGLLLLLPTTLNETKGTLILLPVALVVPALFATGKLRLARLVPIGSVTLVVLTLFFVGYNWAYEEFLARPGKYAHKDLGSFFAVDEGGESGVSKYLLGNTLREQAANLRLMKPRSALAESVHLVPTEEVKQGKTARADFDISDDTRIRRLDMIIAPLVALSQDPVRLLLGLGIGNVSTSALGQDFEGDYSSFSLFLHQGTAASHLLWEMGLIGLLGALVLLYMIWRDALALSRYDNLYGTLALGWLAVTAIALLSIPYKNLIPFNGVSYAFWFYSGIIVATRERVRRAERAGVPLPAWFTGAPVVSVGAPPAGAALPPISPPAASPGRLGGLRPGLHPGLPRLR